VTKKGFVMKVSNVMDKNEFEKIIKACRFCLMCRHLCTVGNITYVETNTPRGQALMIDCMGSEALEDEPDNRKRAAEIFFSCSYCGHCQNNCVSSYQHPDAIMAARSAVQEEDLPEKALELRATVKKYGGFFEDPKQYTAEKRDPDAGEGEPAFDKKGADTLLYFGSFARNRGHEICDAALSFLGKAGADYTVLNKEGGNGMEAYLMGMPDIAQSLLDEEIKRINELRPGRVVCLSPGCQRVFSGGVSGLVADALDIPIVSFSAYALELIKSGKLKLNEGAEGSVQDKPTVAWHDSDQGGRFLQEYEIPREVIAEIPGIVFRDLFWTKGEAASAGESGGLRFLDTELADKIAKKRIDQIVDRGVDILVTDSAAAKAQLESRADENIKILHIAELLNNHT
jgi:Fe-S oxidoreductase